MRINSKISEMQNVLDHVNEINEWEVIDKDVTNGPPKELLDYPMFYNPSHEHLYDFKSRNTELEIVGNVLKDRWSSSKSVFYRRIHLGFQFYIFIDENPDSMEMKDGRLVIRYNAEVGLPPAHADVTKALEKVGDFRFESLKYVFENIQEPDPFEPAFGDMIVRSNTNSLIYIGGFQYPVIFIPYPFIPEVLDGFIIHDVKPNMEFGWFNKEPVGFVNPVIPVLSFLPEAMHGFILK